MNTKTTSILAIISLSVVSLAYAASTIDMPEYGFSIDTLDATPSTSKQTIALMQFLPATDGFGPNVNVTIQPYAATIKDYITLSKPHFSKMNWVIINEKQVGDSEWIVEYKGPMNGNDLHFYGRAVSKNSKVYLATAAAKESQWSSVESVLRSHVDSLIAK